ncbi:vWA domain-containing protein [Brachybacterium paraconglomeratum]|uniref:vWA domain-containing protein n=1 Tax=Brachybacterium paraconglomeratum TaxID=173362 RepID=UPI0022B00460|nr:VWA domain-containing protein [Brachybacterium paraconglomeratum]MCZ4326093.1 VWA domain-containing protein [Brachybacterium paraconglomeratum]
MIPRTAARPLSLALLATLLVSLVVLAPAGLPQARAEGYNTGRTAPSMLVVDGSGSMRADDVGGRSRMDVAKEALSTLVPMLPEDASVGLMTYGNSDPATAASQEAGCQDVKTLVKPDGLDRQALLGAIEGVQPSGYTPIGLSLTKAAAELPEAEMRSIVLVSDGIDECGGPPPCEVAADLAQKHPEMRIHTIGFKAEQDARDELACIAEATGGTFADATDAETLRDELLVKMTRAIQGYATQGQPITGGTSPETAVDLAPGSFLDVLEHGSAAIDDGEGFSRFYRLQLAEGEIAHLTATMVLPGGGGDASSLAQLRLATSSADGVDCRIGEVQARAEADLGQGPITAAVATPRLGETANLTCFGQDADGTVILEVERTGDPALEEAVPVELQFFAEEEVALDGLPPAAKYVRPQEPLAVPTDGEQIQPAFSFASAVEDLDGPMRGTIIPGEVQFFRIPAQYGQQVRAAIALGEFEVPGGMGLTLQARLYSPLRDDVYLVVPPSASGEATGVSTKAAPKTTLQVNQGSPIQFRNREDGGTEARTSFLAGDYYLQLAVVPSDYSAQRLFEVPYVLDLDAVGEPAEGPELSGQGAVEDRFAADPGSAPRASDGGGASDSGGASDAGGAPELEDPPTEDERSGFAVPPVVWAVLGGLGGGVLLAAIVIGAVVLVRRGR